MAKYYSKLQALKDCALIWGVLKKDESVYDFQNAYSYYIKSNAINKISNKLSKDQYANHCPCCEYLKTKNLNVNPNNCKKYCPLTSIFCKDSTYCQACYPYKSAFSKWEDALKAIDINKAFKQANIIYNTCLKLIRKKTKNVKTN